jgi:hypothetical protein
MRIDHAHTMHTPCLQLGCDEVREFDAELVRLNSELARRREDHRAHADRVGVDLELLEERQQEGGGLAGARARHRHHVLPLGDDRDRLALDRRRHLSSRQAGRQAGAVRLAKVAAVGGGGRRAAGRGRGARQ